MPLTPEVLREIETFVRGGFDNYDRIVEIMCQARYSPGELDERAVGNAVSEAFATIRREERTWPPVTDCDRLDRVFTALNKRGVIALQDAGYTQSDGYDDVRAAYDALHESERSHVSGYCFYHRQDLETAVHGQGLYLAFGPIDPSTEDVDGLRIGHVVVEELSKAGFAAEWNGTFGQRIFVRQLTWQRRTVASGKEGGSVIAQIVNKVLARFAQWAGGEPGR